MTAWTIVRDVIMTGLAAYLLVAQSLSPHPNSYLIGAAVSLTAPATATHVRNLTGGGGRSSHSSG